MAATICIRVGNVSSSLSLFSNIAPITTIKFIQSELEISVLEARKYLSVHELQRGNSSHTAFLLVHNEHRVGRLQNGRDKSRMLLNPCMEYIVPSDEREVVDDANLWISLIIAQISVKSDIGSRILCIL